MTDTIPNSEHATSTAVLDSVGHTNRATALGYMWTTLGRFTQAGAQFLVMALLARYLQPSEIGVVGLTLVVINVLMVITEVGLGGAIVQRSQLSATALSTLFWLNWIVAFVLTGLVWLGAASWAIFVGTPSAAPALQALAWALPFAALGVVPTALLNHNMRFRSLAIQDVVASVAASIIALLMAVKGWGLWSLVFFTLSQTALRSVLAFIQAGWRPAASFHFSSLGGGTLSFGLFFALTRLISTLNANLDFLIVGKLISPGALGFYTLAFNMSRIPTKTVANIVVRVAFPVSARLQSNQGLGRQNYLLQLNLLNAVVIPSAVLMMVMPHTLVRLIYGPGWEETAQLLAILALPGAIASLTTLNAPILLGNGRSDWSFYINLLQTPLMFSLVGAGALMGGVIGVAWAILLYFIVAFAIGQVLVGWILKTTTRQVFFALLPGSLSGMLMLVSMLGVNAIFTLPRGDSAAASLMQLVLATGVGTVIYVITLTRWTLYKQLMHFGANVVFARVVFSPRRRQQA